MTLYTNEKTPQIRKLEGTHIKFQEAITLENNRVNVCL